MDKNWLIKHGKKLKDAYSLAKVSKYDISLVKDVIKILRLIDPANANEDYAKEFSKMLQLFDKIVEKKLNQAQNKLIQSLKPRKPRIIN
jgi:hypothetical protein